MKRNKQTLFTFKMPSSFMQQMVLDCEYVNLIYLYLECMMQDVACTMYTLCNTVICRKPLALVHFVAYIPFWTLPVY